MTIPQYLTVLNTRYQTGINREHSYRPDLQNLLKALLPPDILITNEPARIACGAPDYILTRIEIPIGYIEAKDIGTDLNAKTHQKQFTRYRTSLANLIITDYLGFQFFKDGNLIAETHIGKVENGKIVPLPQNFTTFTNLIQNFAQVIAQTITSPTKLAHLMASRAKLMAEVIENALHKDDEQQKISPLKAQMLAFKNLLIHDIENPQFADLYAQTITYGMFAARYHDPTLPTFSRHEAATLIPKSNPFLRKLFQDIAGYDLDDRLAWIVDELVQIFLASDVADIMKTFGQTTQQEDPVIHFYETFLAAYNPLLRKARGVWYTPQPVVNFIVRAVDDILKTDFNLPQGIADTAKIKTTTTIQGKKTEQEVHKVQILDPATGTGTFLAQVIKHIHQKFAGQQGIWSSYVENHLIPRLNGFELLMASYAMAHLKLDMLLTQTGYQPTGYQRLKVFLTNSLEEYHPDTGTLFASWLSDEANQANLIKRDAPVMVVLGNPPYSISTTNKGKWIENLIADYKKDLNERKINLDDDYIKFIRFGQHFIDKNGSGILAYISNNSFIDGVTHRQMRRHLLESFDAIYILDLHGNARKKETCADGSPDNNVFDIMQGVSINIFIKTGKKKKGKLGKVFHAEIQGKRDTKYEFLNMSKMNTIDWHFLDYSEPYHFFVPKNFNLQSSYDNGFMLSEFFIVYSAGIKTKVDHIATDLDKDELSIRIEDIISNNLSFDEIRRKYGLSERTTWEFKPLSKLIFKASKICKYEYRPFDYRFTYYENRFLSRTRSEVMDNFFNHENIGIETSRNGDYMFIGKNVSDEHFISGNSFKFPLYLYPETGGQQSLNQSKKRVPNLNAAIVAQIAKQLGLTFTNEKDTSANSSSEDTFAPIDILDYIYAVLHSPAYREKYKEFLKIDFPRVPYPTNKTTFWQLVQIGSQLRQIHLLESPLTEQYLTQYPIQGSNEVTKITFENSHPLEGLEVVGNVYINQTQYFAGVPLQAWQFYIGGYQPAQKWLKDRKGRTLTFEDIMHYQKIIVALQETHRLMQTIDSIGL
ncbi:DNA methyltransferase [Sphingobacteriales bacterium UPWRP_1]|nr:DNA methyltransferase [Sphingobacteriales bacterium TSM_CSS]PSJ72587.1 DNA methyltransferase [Sphingobacteriales bacterium UPWRP_1]